jgi:hypothetical protein
MQIIRSHEQEVKSRGDENRKVRFFFNDTVGAFDWLMVTRSYKNEVRSEKISISDHTHPNALELIVFNKPGKLEINNKIYSFDVNDSVLLDPEDVHGAMGLNTHDCICILLGIGEPKKG